MRVLLIAGAAVLGLVAGLLIASRPDPAPQAAPQVEQRLIAIQQDLQVIKVIKQGYFENRIDGFNQRLDALVAEIEDMAITDRPRCVLLWQIKDYVVQFQVPISQDTWHILDQLPARHVGPEARYFPDRPVASEERGMQGYDLNRVRK